ncbi:hypothetical protein BCR44DRAFT_1497135 [Catenaria anguillulae PL171]|uniref:Glycosyltransferase family 28 N-terminal domain-containing protein n=1 Tax=Catenaria anguillulae PL171 TaxID=765915 RepID=A0A1Y2HX33_9FUNG|nr:hypothetical protein BCR44DRAFT_1497135 [Catenaria anguillulae PL171]
MTAPTTLFFICIGTRGDVQPYLALAQGLKSRRPNQFKMVFLAHPEFESFVLKHNAIDVFHPIAPSMIHEANMTEVGREAKKHQSLLNLEPARQFFTNLFRGWTGCVKSALELHGPADVMFCTQFAARPNILGLIKSLPVDQQPRINVLHTFPSYPTWECVPPMLNLGSSLPLGLLNALAWKFESAVAHGYIDLPAAQLVCKEFGIEPWPANGEDPKYAIAREPTWAAQHIYSLALYGRPADWPANQQVVGFLPYSPPTAAARLPANLDAFVDTAKARGKPVVYVGFGSMLGVAFESDEVILDILQRVYNGLVGAHAQYPGGFRAILHTVTSQTGGFLIPDSAVAAISSDVAAEIDILVLTEPVAHDLLFPKCDVAVQHGGVGTLQTSLMHGCVPVVFPCLAVTDQPFWASVVAKRGMGVNGGPAIQMTADSFSASVQAALQGLNGFKSVVGAVSEGIKRDDAVEKVLAWLEEC